MVVISMMIIQIRFSKIKKQLINLMYIGFILFYSLPNRTIEATLRFWKTWNHKIKNEFIYSLTFQCWWKIKQIFLWNHLSRLVWFHKKMTNKKVLHFSGKGFFIGTKHNEKTIVVTSIHKVEKCDAMGWSNVETIRVDLSCSLGWLRHSHWH